MDYLLAMAVGAGMSITPFPMPPTWLVMVLLVVRLDSPAAALVVAGAIGTALGRTGLAAGVRVLGTRAMGTATRENVAYLAERLRGRRTRLGVAGVLVVSPPPSAALYTAAGMLRINLAVVFLSCLAGRLITYGVGVALLVAPAEHVAGRVRDAASPPALTISGLAIVALLWLLVRLDWRTLLERRRLRLRLRRAGHRPPAPPSDGRQ